MAENVQHPICNLLIEEHIVDFLPTAHDTQNGTLRVYEQCDTYYHCVLTPAELRQLANELQQIATALEAKQGEPL